MRFRITLSSVLAAIALAIILVPSGVLAEDLGFPYYGGLSDGKPSLLPCTGFIQLSGTTMEKKYDANGKEAVDDKGNQIYEPVPYKFSAVSDKAINGLPQCRSMCDVFVFVNRLIVLGLSVLITIFLPIMILIGGFYVLTGGGNPGQRAKGMKIITATLVGLAITAGAFLIVNEMLLLIFKQGYGNALQQAVKDQIKLPGQNLGLTEKDIPSFSWNSISCSVTASGVTLGSGTPTTPNPDTNDPPIKTPPIIKDPPTPQGVAKPATCYEAAGPQTLSCAAGWIGVTPANKIICGDDPKWTHICRMVAPPKTCYDVNDATIDSFACSGAWTRTGCAAGPEGTDYRMCGPKTGTDTNPVPSLCSTERNQCVSKDTTDAVCGTTYKPGERGCSAEQRCCKLQTPQTTLPYQVKPTGPVVALNCLNRGATDNNTNPTAYKCLSGPFAFDARCKDKDLKYSCKINQTHPCQQICSQAGNAWLGLGGANATPNTCSCGPKTAIQKL